MMIHDENGYLTDDAKRVALEYIIDKPAPHCCTKPQYLYPVLNSWPTLTLNSDGKSTNRSSSGTLPVVSFLCASCGAARTYLAAVIFTDWARENTRIKEKASTQEKPHE